MTLRHSTTRQAIYGPSPPTDGVQLGQLWVDTDATPPELFIAVSLGPVVYAPVGGASGGQAAILFEDEGSGLGTTGTVTSVDFVGAGVVASRTANEITVTIAGGAAVPDGDKGDITVSAAGTVWVVDAGAITLAKQADVATARLLGRVTAATGAQEVLTGTQATTLLDNVTAALKGLAPASGGGTTNFLRADATWSAPPGGGTWGSITGTLSSQTDLQTALDAKLDDSQATAFGLSLLGDADSTAGRTTLGLGTLATQSGTFSGTSSGTNTGDNATNTLYSGLVSNATHTGEVTGATTLTITDGAVTLAKQADIATARLMGRVTAGAGIQETLTGTQATTLIDNFTSGLKGAVPGSGGGTVNYMRADGTWAEPPGTGGGGAPTNASYVTIGLNGTLTDERTLAVGAGLSLADGGANAAVTLGRAAFTGDVTAAANVNTLTIAAGAVTLAKQADVATARIMGRITAATGVQESLTGTQATTLLDLFTSGLQGLVPGSGGGTANFMRADGTWAAPTAGAGGSTTQVQFNNAGALAGATEVGVSDNKLILSATAAEPSAPATDLLRVYARSVAGRMMPKWMGPSGVDTCFQPAFFQNRILMYVPSTGTTGTGSGAGIGPVWTSSGTVSHPNPSSTAPAISNQMRRTRWANVVTTTNQTLGCRAATSNTRNYWRGSAVGLGGFYYVARFIVELYPASTVRLFAGLTTSTGYVSASDTVANDTCGLWHDTTDPSTGSGAFNFVTRNTATTTKQPIDLANAIVAGNSYDFYMFCTPNGDTIFWRLDDTVNAVTYSDSQTTTLPVATAFMGPQCSMSNGTANLTVTTTAIGVAGIYTEADR